MSKAKIVSGSQTSMWEEHPHLDFTRIIGNAKPTKVTRGIIEGYSLPIYNSDDEELYLLDGVPNYYSEAADIFIHVHCYLDTANTGKNFKLQIEWEHYTIGTDIVPATVNTITVETATGTASQYQSYEIDFTIDYDIDGGDTIAIGDEVALRVRRIAASANEITGEVVITQIGSLFPKDKIGN